MATASEEGGGKSSRKLSLSRRKRAVAAASPSLLSSPHFSARATVAQSASPLSLRNSDSDGGRAAEPMPLTPKALPSLLSAFHSPPSPPLSSLARAVPTQKREGMDKAAVAVNTAKGREKQREKEREKEPERPHQTVKEETSREPSSSSSSSACAAIEIGVDPDLPLDSAPRAQDVEEADGVDCAVCGTSMTGMSLQARTQHVNACLDALARSPSRPVVPKKAKAGGKRDKKSVASAGVDFARLGTCPCCRTVFKPSMAGRTRCVVEAAGLLATRAKGGARRSESAETHAKIIPRSRSPSQLKTRQDMREKDRHGAGGCHCDGSEHGRGAGERPIKAAACKTVCAVFFADTRPFPPVHLALAARRFPGFCRDPRPAIPFTKVVSEALLLLRHHFSSVIDVPLTTPPSHNCLLWYYRRAASAPAQAQQKQKRAKRLPSSGEGQVSLYEHCLRSECSQPAVVFFPLSRCSFLHPNYYWDCFSLGRGADRRLPRVIGATAWQQVPLLAAALAFLNTGHCRYAGVEARTPSTFVFFCCLARRPWPTTLFFGPACCSSPNPL